jgi:hypothetical protein
MRQPTAEFSHHGTPAFRRTNVGRCAAGVALAAFGAVGGIAAWVFVRSLPPLGLARQQWGGRAWQAPPVMCFTPIVAGMASPH